MKIPFFNCIRPFKFHSFSKWRTIGDLRLFEDAPRRPAGASLWATDDDEEMPYAVYKRQMRECENCGFLQYKKDRV